MNVDIGKLGLKIALALLLYYGEISVNDIKSMPFFTDSDDSDIVISLILKQFDAELYVRKIASYPIPEWEEVIRLKNS